MANLVLCEENVYLEIKADNKFLLSIDGSETERGVCFLLATEKEMEAICKLFETRKEMMKVFPLVG